MKTQKLTEQEAQGTKLTRLQRPRGGSIESYNLMTEVGKFQIEHRFGQWRINKIPAAAVSIVEQLGHNDVRFDSSYDHKSLNEAVDAIVYFVCGKARHEDVINRYWPTRPVTG